MHLINGRIRHHHPAFGGMHRDTFGPCKPFGQALEVTRYDQSIDAAGQPIGDDNATLRMLGDGGWSLKVVEDRDPLTNSERFDAERRQQDQ